MGQQSLLLKTDPRDLHYLQADFQGCRTEGQQVLKGMVN